MHSSASETTHRSATPATQSPKEVATSSAIIASTTPATEERRIENNVYDNVDYDLVLSSCCCKSCCCRCCSESCRRQCAYRCNKGMTKFTRFFLIIPNLLFMVSYQSGAWLIDWLIDWASDWREDLAIEFKIRMDHVIGILSSMATESQFGKSRWKDRLLGRMIDWRFRSLKNLRNFEINWIYWVQILVSPIPLLRQKRKCAFWQSNNIRDSFIHWHHLTTESHIQLSWHYNVIIIQNFLREITEIINDFVKSFF